MNERRVVFPVFNEGTTPMKVRVEPIGLEHVVLPGHVVHVLAKGPPNGALEIERSNGEITVYGWGGAQVAISNERDATAVADRAVFLRRLGEAFAPWTSEHRAVFAALLAARHERELGDDGDTRSAYASGSPREMIETLWATAKGDPLTDEKIERFLSDLRDVAALVDPDRVNAGDVYRALGVLEEALRACAGAPASGALALTLAGLAVSAQIAPRGDGESSQKLETRWSWMPVQAEARWLDVVTEALSMLSVVDGAAVDALAAAFEPSAEVGARVVKLKVGAKTIAFIGVDGEPRFRAEVDGERRLIRSRRTHRQVSEGGDIGGTQSEVAWVESAAADIGPLLACLAANGRRSEWNGKTVFSRSVQTGHFRQNQSTTITLAIAADGAIEIETEISTQDDSYY